MIGYDLYLVRRFKKSGYTIGRLERDKSRSGGVEYVCDTLEPQERYLDKNPGDKVKGLSAIPTGVYRLHVRWSDKFRSKVVEVQGVPGFTGILIHGGNTPSDTEGCILPGRNKVRGEVVDSRLMLDKIVEYVEEGERRSGCPSLVVVREYGEE